MNPKKPLIRTIHNLSCSGGSVLCKCIASMQRTIVISEVHPDQLINGFNPYDPLQLLLAQTSLGENSSLRHQIFLKRIIDTDTILRNNNLNTVLRDHTHSDYLIQNSIDQINNNASLIEVVNKHFEICSVLSLRNPLHSYSSLIHNNWNNAITSFEDYCSRVLLMLQTYEKLGALIVKYEDFCINPDLVLKQICEKLMLDFSPNYAENFYNIPMTGDSGRASGIKTIKQLKPRKVDQSILEEAASSKSFMQISSQYSY